MTTKATVMFVLKLVVSVAFDVVDFTVGRLPGFELLVDLAGVFVAVAMWGPTGLIAAWELLDPSGQIDGFVPTLTLIALSRMGAGGSPKTAQRTAASVPAKKR